MAWLSVQVAQPDGSPNRSAGLDTRRVESSYGSAESDIQQVDWMGQ